MNIFVYLNDLTGAIFKILPYKEDEDNGVERFLSAHIESLWNRMRGACADFPELGESREYIKMCNLIAFLATEEFDQKTCRRTVLTALNLLDKLKNRFGGEVVG